MNYNEACEYLNQISSINPGLETVRELANRLGNPQEKLKFVHIAGTNGKGSVLNFISSVLKAANYRTGRFFSPSLSSYHERFQINNRIISKANFLKYFEIVKNAADSMVSDGLRQPTAFEIDTVLAFLYFAEENCDIVVLEAGMGGKLDATNIIEKPLVAVITPISLDHTDYLGKTYSEIASHKAGIIKENVPVVCGQQEQDSYDVIREKCRECDSIFYYSPINYVKHIHRAKPDLDNLTFMQYFNRENWDQLKDLEIGFAGLHQVDNATIALDALIFLRRGGFEISMDQIRKGFKEAVWPGRFEMINRIPRFIVDGAHNAGAAKRLVETIKFYFPTKRIIFIMGILRDKDYQGIIENTYQIAEHIITVTPPGPRGMPSYELAVEVAKLHPKTTAADSIAEACELAILLAERKAAIVAFGSLTLVDAIKKVVVKKLKE